MSSKFNEIFLRSKTVSEKLQRGYKIYTDKDNFQLIDAQTVAEAFEKSGIKSPFRVEIAGVITKSIFTQFELSENQAVVPVPENSPVTPATPTATDTITATSPA